MVVGQKKKARAIKTKGIHMHSVSPYSLRCFDASVNGSIEDKYVLLNNIKGHDAFSIIQDFIDEKSQNFTVLEDSKQVYKFHNFTFNPATREIHGWFEVGTFGIKTNIINVQTGNIDYTKIQNNAEIIQHFIHFKLPTGVNEGITLLHSYRNNGIKTLFYEQFGEFFRARTQLTLQMNPLSYQRGLDEWNEAVTKELRLIKFNGLEDKADQLSGLGHEEQILIMKPARNKNLGRLLDYFTPNSEQSNIVELLEDECSTISTVVELNGKRRTFRVGHNAINSICVIDLDDNVGLVDGNPEIVSMFEWCQQITREFTDQMYPGVVIP